MDSDAVKRFAHLLSIVLSSIVVGAVGGIGSWALFEALDQATSTRLEHRWLVWLLPLAAGILGFTYWKFGGSANRGTSIVIANANGGDGTEPVEPVPARMAPMIFGATYIAQLTGASVGREGAALQISGSVTSLLARPLRLSDGDRGLLMTAAMAGAFGGAFGVPLAGAIFGLEVQRTGRLRYEGVVPALVASVTADLVVEGLGRSTPISHLVIDLDWWMATRLAALGVVAGLAARLFIVVLRLVRTIAERTVAFTPLRPVVGGLATLALMLLLGRDYLGLSLPLVDHALAGDLADWWDPLLKILFTAVALGCGIPGGEVTPLFVVGATLGSVMSAPLGLPPAITAAVCLGAVFGAASNTPVACAVLVIELFGAHMAIPAAIVGVVAYAVSPREGIYSGQRPGSTKDLRDPNRRANAAPPPHA
ncbi:MAG: voltage-gated chloride channel protein [Actinobacteria bacterium]|nr:voltage-gated chloride channel protein [Actinomycetota bacterium]